ncbi:MAG: TonB-dependent receptor plug domain-containing protein, partial [Cyclobacteriaceae bacterium]|nr:TonB-dependent receptor plug domain-containing protein [Cyclobacteriaceae bacterium]
MCLRYLIPFLLYFLWPDLVKGQRQNKSTFKELSIDNIDTLDHNVSHVDSADVFLVTHKIQAQRFNCGCSDDPLQLLQGKVPGTLIVRPGSDPNRPFDFRIGGTSSLRYREKNSFGPMTLNTATRPLILVDGLPIENTWVVDPNDVDGLEVLSGAGASSFYGIRGANGVLKIKTIEGKEGLGVSYKTSFTFEKAMRRQLVLTADQFRGKDNTVDYGYDTDWFKAITRPAFSQMHHLALSGGRKNAFYRLSMNFRDRQGILKTTGHERINMRFNYTQFALKNKLKVTARVAFMDIGARYGFDEVFKYAYHFNPTAPVKVTEETSILHPDIFNKWGGYFQEEKYDYRNPVAVLEQNKNEGASKYSSYHFVGEYELMDDLSVSIGYSLQEEHERQGKYYGKRSYFEGDWSHLQSNGMAYWSSGDRDVKNLNVETKYSYTSGKLNLGLNGGYMWQEVFLSTIDARGGGFVSDHFSYHNLGAALDFAEGAGKVDSYKEKTTLLSFYGKAHAIYDNLGFIDINIRRDGYTPLGINNKWGTFGGGVAGINWSAILDMPFVEYMTTRVGYGVVGNYKGEAGLSLEQ